MNGVFKDGAYYPLGTGEEMSEGEYEFQRALCDEPPDYIDRHSFTERHGCWRVRGGAILKIRKMTTSHLQNAIALFERGGQSSHPKLVELRDELKRRGS